MTESKAMTDPMELVERLDKKARASFEANKAFGRRGKEWAIETEVEWQAAACIRELVDQRDQARAVITDTCAKASWMEPLAGDDVTKETIALVASRCRAFEQMAALAPADRGGV